MLILIVSEFSFIFLILIRIVNSYLLQTKMTLTFPSESSFKTHVNTSTVENKCNVVVVSDHLIFFLSCSESLATQLWPPSHVLE